MNAFQILDNQGKPIPINTLDKEVCEIIGNEVDPKYYCDLGRRSDYPEGMQGEIEYLRRTINWYDSIGWLIASEGLSFEGILQHYADGMKEFIGKVDEDGTVITLERIYPYHCMVLNTFINKGYTAKQSIQ